MNKVRRLLYSGVTAIHIAKVSGIAQSQILRYRKNEADLGNMSVDVAKKPAAAWDTIQQEPDTGKLKIKGIRKAVTDYNNYVGTARVYFDPGDMSFWTNLYAGSNDYDRYHDPAIVRLIAKGSPRMDTMWDKTSMRAIRKAVAMHLSSIAGELLGHERPRSSRLKSRQAVRAVSVLTFNPLVTAKIVPIFTIHVFFTVDSPAGGIG